MKATTKAFNPGFSLIELVIVVAILGVITAIAVPRFADASSGRKLQAARTAIIADIENLKLKARASSSQYVIMFDIDNERYVFAKGNEVTRDSIVFVRELDEEPFGIQIHRTNRSATGTAIITPFGDLSPPVTIEITDGSTIIRIDLDGVPDAGTSPVVGVSTDEVTDLDLIGGAFDALNR